MKRLEAAVCSACIILVSITPAFSVNDKRLKKEFQALYARQIEVGKTRDVKAMMEFNTTDYSVKLRRDSIFLK